ncbi:MAG TPA: glycosyltransferase family A protein [Parafilimonas sp.]|nr:glycosyltransferase family A protein [Parafilimonas sp.]
METIKKDISVIIPCYNAIPQYLKEAIDSIINNCKNFTYEIIVINDGSTNNDILTLLNGFKNEDIIIIDQQNQGPSAARNNGVKKSTAEYILCLDSDNKIKPEYINKAIAALNENLEAAVVYAKPDFIGNEPRSFIPGPFSIEKLLVENHIDMCSVIRKQAWENVGGLDESLRQYEDWEFWVRIYKTGWKFIFIDEILFEYRVRKDSLITQAGQNGYNNIIAYLYKKHWDLLYSIYYKLYATSVIYNEDKRHPLRSFLKYSKKKFIG